MHARSGANCCPVYGHRLSEARGQGVAIIGAVGGAAVNLAFIEQYHGLARGHFTVRRLERVYGAEAVRAEYDQLSRSPDLDIRGSCQLDLAETGRRLRAQSAVPPR